MSPQPPTPVTACRRADQASGCVCWNPVSLPFGEHAPMSRVHREMHTSTTHISSPQPTVVSEPVPEGWQSLVSSVALGLRQPGPCVASGTGARTLRGCTWLHAVHERHVSRHTVATYIVPPVSRGVAQQQRPPRADRLYTSKRQHPSTGLDSKRQLDAFSTTAMPALPAASSEPRSNITNRPGCSGGDLDFQTRHLQ